MGAKSFLSFILSPWKSKRRLPRACSDCRDFVKARPQAPNVAQLRREVQRQQFGSVGPAATPAEALHREMATRQTVFDLQYRCGAAGRCCCSADESEAGGGDGGAGAVRGDDKCRFPTCFTMRPLTKGAEVLAVRLAYEVDDAPTAKIRALVQLAREECLPAAVQGIQQLADAEIRLAAGGRTLHAAFRQHQHQHGGDANTGGPHPRGTGIEGYEVNPAEVKYGTESAVGGGGINPLVEHDSLREEVVSLYLWRAALLVNMREDERAVSSLLNLAALLAPSGSIRSSKSDANDNERSEKDSGHYSNKFQQLQHDRLRLYTAAATWAGLNDMEIVYYRSLLKQYEPFPLAETFAHDRPLLLRRVVESCSPSGSGSSKPADATYCSYDGDAEAEAAAYITECVAHVVFTKEVTATVSRAQAAQKYGDLTEDPVRSLCLPLALRYYRFHVGRDFWEHFFRLLCMPPIPPPGRDEKAELLGHTPNHVLDAVGRSMLLHHLLMLHEAREREVSNGAVASTLQALHEDQKCAAAARGGAKDEILVHPSHYERILTDQERLIVATRLRELLVVGRGYESRLAGKTPGGNTTRSDKETNGGGGCTGSVGSSNND